MSAPREQAREALVVWLVLLVAAALRGWDLADHGFDNLYYSPAVWSMASDWHAFWFESFDPAGFLAIGKPPVAFWMQALSVRLLGFDALAIHLPQVVAGLASVLLVFLLARRVTGLAGSALAALVAALTPASVAVDRSNLADSWLLLGLLGAAASTLSASDRGSAKRLALGAALVGVGFMTKFTVAYLALPAMFLTYLLTAPVTIGRRATHLALAALVVAVTSLAWPVAVDLTPRERRPYIAETTDSSMLSLAFGFQGLGRMTNRAGPGTGGDRALQPGPASPATGAEAGGTGRTPSGASFPGPSDRRPEAGPGPPRQGITGHGGTPGPLRLANRDMAGHISWFLPVILVGAVAAIRRRSPGGPRPRARRDAFFWTVWFLTFAAVFSLPRTFIHSYYLTMLAPAVAVLTALTAGVLWRGLEHGRALRVLAAAAVALTLLWHSVILGSHPPWGRALVPALGLAGLASVIGLWAARRPRLRAYALGLGGAAAFVCPLLWSATPALAPTGRMVPIADPALLDYRAAAAAERARPTHLPALARFLRANRRGERFLLAVRDIHRAAPVILESREAVMAFGGYYGTEPAVGVEAFARMVSSGEVRYVLLAAEGGAGGTAGPSPSPAVPNAIEEWVKGHGTLVPAGAWESPGVGAPRASAPMPMWGPTDQMVATMYGGSGLRLYDCGAERD